jgi:hypothetical protein
MRSVTALVLMLPAIFCSCTSSDVESSSMAVVAVPVIAAYGSAYSTKAGYQNVCIISHLPDKAYAAKITEMPSYKWNGCSLTDTYMYMGSKGDYHFIAHYPPLGLRNILKISKAEYSVENEFSLTSRSKLWRLIELPADTIKNQVLRINDILILNGDFDYKSEQFQNIDELQDIEIKLHNDASQTTNTAFATQRTAFHNTDTKIKAENKKQPL